MHHIWDLEEGIYRVKPQVKHKFKVGDVLVDKGEKNKQNVIFYKVEEVCKDSYVLDNSVITNSEFIENEFVLITEVLWYFEIYDHVTKKYYMRSTRMTMNEMEKEFGDNHYTLSWKPIYSLGFKLKEN